MGGERKGRWRPCHPWHDLEPGTPEEFCAVVEIPARSKVKYELDLPSGLIRVAGFVFGSCRYPYNYGLIPRTQDVDGDPLDVIIVMSEEVAPLSLLTCRPIGVMHMLDTSEVEEGVRDEKIIAVCSTDPETHDVHDISDLSANKIRELVTFFEDYKRLTTKKRIVVDEFDGREAAIRVILQCREIYASFVLQSMYGESHRPKAMKMLTPITAGKVPTLTESAVEILSPRNLGMHSDIPPPPQPPPPPPLPPIQPPTGEKEETESTTNEN